LRKSGRRFFAKKRAKSRNLERGGALRALKTLITRRAAATRAVGAGRPTISAIVALVCLGPALGFGAKAAVADPSRGALWNVVQACLLTHRLTGAAFPCLEVNVSDGAGRGYVILRPPLDSSDLILAPARKSAGVEDPSLEAPDAPNYFEDAWDARKFLRDTPQEPLAHDGVVLAVNSRFSRTQDQLHIHIGCLNSGARRTLRAFLPALSTDRWIPLGKPFYGREFWGRLVAQDNLSGINPFRLAAEAWPNASMDRSRLTLAVAGIELANGGQRFVLLASFQNGRHSVEGLLDASCR
jgi:CDP-diacylglycerol pyrophosphatase